MISAESHDLSTEDVVRDLSAEQQAAVARLEGIVAGARQLGGRDSESLAFLAAQQLVAHPLVAATPPALELRASTGGMLPSVRTDDDVAAAAVAVALEFLGAFIVEPHRFGSFAAASSAVTVRSQSPTVEAFGSAILADPQLGPGFGGPADSWSVDDLDAGLDYVTNTGLGSGVQLALLAPTMLGAVATRLWCEGRFEPQTFVEAVVGEVTAVRRLIGMGRQVPSRTIVGLTGIDVPEGTEVDLGEPKRLRRATEAEQRLMSSMMGTSPVSAVIETTFPFRMLVGSFDDSSLREHQERLMRDALQDFDRSVNHARLALALGMATTALGALAVVGRVIFAPLMFTPVSLSYVGRVPASAPQLDARTIDRIQERSQALQTTDLGRIEVAVRRLLSALERPTATDGFIDAVIGWDNLFGTRQGESTMRIAFSFAHLLGKDDVSRREEISAEIRAAYDLRSQIVHGSEAEVPLEDAYEKRGRAIQLLEQALDALLLDRPDLLSGDGADRSHSLLIGRCQG
jgi:hypothetical protein